ncbi:hypothetical protein Tco_1554395 [Tanacetum coccineum]
MMMEWSWWCGSGVDDVGDEDGGDEGGSVMEKALNSETVEGKSVVATRMYHDLSLRTSGPLQDPTTATITTIIITNGDGLRRVRTFQENISQNKGQQLGGTRGRAYAIGGGILYSFC